MSIRYDDLGRRGEYVLYVCFFVYVLVHAASPAICFSGFRGVGPASWTAMEVRQWMWVGEVSGTPRGFGDVWGLGLRGCGEEAGGCVVGKGRRGCGVGYDVGAGRRGWGEGFMYVRTVL